MKNLLCLSPILLFAASCLPLPAQRTTVAQRPANQIIAYIFVKDRTIAPGEVDAKKLTRINYAFANVKDGKVVTGFAHDRENYEILNQLKQQNPSLKVLASVGGWTWSGAFSDVSLTAASRKKFIDSAVEFVRGYKLDGIDIDWEYPGQTGNGNTFRPEDKQNYTLLLKEMRERFDREGKLLGRHLYTSVATAGDENFLAHTEMPQVARYLDSVNLMCYDYYEPDSDKNTGNHAPLYTDPADPKHISADASVKLYLAAGVPAHKIVLGVPFYGHTWGNVAAANHGLFQPGSEVHLDANYHSIVDNLLKNGYTRYWDGAAAAPYLYNPSKKIFVSYEDPESLKLKSRYVLEHDLGGVMFWEYSGDHNHELVNTIAQGLTASAEPRP